MKTYIEKLKNSEIKLTIELNEEDLSLYTREAEEILSNSLYMNGFRKGKVPPEIALKKVGEKSIKEKALDISLKRSFIRALKQEKIDLIDTFEMKITKNNPGNLTYEILLLVSPEIVLGDYKNVEIEKKSLVVTEQEINNALHYVQKSRAQLKDSDRPIQKGNRVEVDFEIKHKGKQITGGKSENHPLIVGDGKFVPGFEDKLIGARKGDKKYFSLQVPDDYYQKSIAGKKLDFNVKIKRVQKVILPELNNEFAKMMGSFKDIDALRRNIAEGISMEKEAKEKERIRLAILDKIVENTRIEVPPKLIERQLDLMLRNFDDNLHRQGLELSLYLAQIKKTQEDLRKEWYEQAVKQVKTSFILKEIGKKEGITIGDDEVKLAVNNILQKFDSIKEARESMDLGEFENKIRTNLLNDKIIDFLEKKVKVK